MNALAAGAGASEGLHEYLAQLLREKQIADEQKRTAESGRHNLAEEGLSGRTIDENAKYRQAQQEANKIAADRLETTRREAESNRIRDDQRAGLDDLIPGASISIPTRNSAVKTGAALPERFKPVVPYADDFMGPVNETGPQRGEVGSYTLEGQDKKAGAQGVIEQKTYVLDGKPIDGFLNNRTGKILSKTGEDITAKVDHYTAPDRTLIQTGEGYDTRAHATSEINKGGNVPLATPAATRTREDLADRVSTHFDDIQQMLDEANKKGVLGPIAGRTYNDFLAGKIGTTGDAATDELLGELRQNLSLARSGLAQLHGRGGANVGIVQGLEKNMDAGHMSYDELKGSLKAMKSWVDTYAKKKGSGGTAAAAPPADDAYSQYLKRTQPQQ